MIAEILMTNQSQEGLSSIPSGLIPSGDLHSSRNHGTNQGPNLVKKQNMQPADSGIWHSLLQ